MSGNTTIRVLHINVNKNNKSTEHILQAAINRKIDIIAIQEPWLSGDNDLRKGGYTDHSHRRSINHSSFTQDLPISTTPDRPMVAFYINKFTEATISLTNFHQHTSHNFLAIDVKFKEMKFQVLNVYNPADNSVFTNILKPSSVTSHALLVGDFNTHHPMWDTRHEESLQSNDFVDWIDDQDLILLNEPDKGTFWRTPMKFSSVLDLSLVTLDLANKVSDWTILPDTLSDHNGVIVSLQSSSAEDIPSPLKQDRYNTKKADWDKFSKVFSQELDNSHHFGNLISQGIIPTPELSKSILENNSTPETLLMENAAQSLTEAIQTAAKEAIPLVERGVRAKPWWDDNLLQPYKDAVKARRDFYRVIGSDTPEEITLRTRHLEARATYSKAISKAKKNHWNQFLCKSTPDTIWKAFKYTSSTKIERIPEIKDETSTPQNTFPTKCSALRAGLFPPPPITDPPEWNNYTQKDWEWPDLSQEELLYVCTAACKGKTPGPDQISSEIVLAAVQTQPLVFFQFYSTLINTGYHPTIWRQATGAVLKKVGKDDYSIPKSYRVISLLNCLGKVSEKIMAYRLGELAETTDLIHPSQLGGRKKKSAIDAALLLTDWVQNMKKAGLRPTTLFLDIKGAYDYVSKNQLLTIMAEKGLPLSLIAFVKSFLNERQVRLAFDGEIEEFTEVNTGIPQGSPISPILFLIYISKLFSSNTVFHISYVDDVSISVATLSLERNMEILQREANKLIEAAASMAILFDDKKIDLIHFVKTKRDTPSFKLPDGSLKAAKPLVKWLGIHFDQSLTFKQHIHIRLGKARTAFYRLNRLTNTERGLTAAAVRQIYLACVMSTGSYGCQLYWRGQQYIQKLFQKIQNLGLRKILGVFKTAPTSAMEAEAALPPPHIHLDNMVREYAFRIHKLPRQHPIHREIIKAREIPFEDRPPRQKRYTQIQRIAYSIENYISDIGEEPIQHSYFMPWNKKLPFSVRISKLKKKEQADVHNQFITSQLNTNTIALYSDASSVPGGKGVGVSFVAYSLEGFQPAKIHQEKYNLGHGHLVYNGELEGIVQAAEWAEKEAPSHSSIHIFADNQAALWRLAKPSDEPGQQWQIRLIRACTNLLNKSSTTILNWVPGHKDVRGNEEADKLAKEACNLNPATNSTSLAMIRTLIKSEGVRAWKKLLIKTAKEKKSSPHSNYFKNFPWQIRKSLRIPIDTPKSVSSAFYQLKLGHGYFAQYLHRFNLRDDDSCWCGQSQTPRHLVLDCFFYRKHRKKAFQNLQTSPLIFRNLFTRPDHILGTLNLLTQTQISTREWLLYGVEAEEEEEILEEA